MTRDVSICLLSDRPGGEVSSSLNLLYPGRVTDLSILEADHGIEALRPYSHVVTMVGRRANIDRLNYAAVRQFAEEGGTVASCLSEYAHSRGLPMVKTVLPPGDTSHPGIRICAQSDITRGFAPGDVTPWFGKVAGGIYNHLHANQYYQRQIMGLEGAGSTTILGVSTINAGAMLIEERVGEGRIMAHDLLSPSPPYFDSWGSTNKYLFLGNLIGGSVRYGKHYPRKLPYDELMVQMQQLAERLPGLTCVEEGACSDGRPLMSLNVGTPGKPAFFFHNGMHGWEWEAGYGLLHLAELLGGDEPPEGLTPDRYFLKLIPQINPYGYDMDFRHNANGVDLNRNADFVWDPFVGGEDSWQPWDFDYKGPAPASEPEVRIAQEIVRQLHPVGMLDFHTAYYEVLKPHKGDRELIDAIHREIDERIEDRYIAQVPYSTEYKQVGKFVELNWKPNQPNLFLWAAEQGVPVSLLIEMSGNRSGTHALVMNVDTTIEICLALMTNCLAKYGG